MSLNTYESELPVSDLGMSGVGQEFDPKAYLQQGAWRDVKLGLHRTRELLERLGRPQDGLRIVHVAGTNGKGSTSAFIAGILQAAGYKTGLFTSPYIPAFQRTRPGESARYLRRGSV